MAAGRPGTPRTSIENLRIRQTKTPIDCRKTISLAAGETEETTHKRQRQRYKGRHTQRETHLRRDGLSGREGHRQ